MFAVFWRTILDRKRSLLVFLSIGVAMMWMYVVTYPTVQATSATVADFVKALPPELSKAFALDPRSFTTFEGFVAGKQFSMVWPMMMVMLVAGLAANYIAGEVEKGTIELVLSQPISRLRIITSKVLSGVAVCALFSFVTVLSVIPLTRIYGITTPESHFWLVSGIGFCFGLAVFGLSMFASAFMSERGKALFLAIGVLLAMYVVNIVALLKVSLEDIKFASYFYYFDYSGMLLDGKIGKLSAIVLLGAFFGFIIAGVMRFNKRDISG